MNGPQGSPGAQGAPGPQEHGAPDSSTTKSEAAIVLGRPIEYSDLSTDDVSPVAPHVQPGDIWKRQHHPAWGAIEKAQDEARGILIPDASEQIEAWRNQIYYLIFALERFIEPLRHMQLAQVSGDRARDRVFCHRGVEEHDVEGYGSYKIESLDLEFVALGHVKMTPGVVGTTSATLTCTRVQKNEEGLMAEVVLGRFVMFWTVSGTEANPNPLWLLHGAGENGDQVEELTMDSFSQLVSRVFT